MTRACLPLSAAGAAVMIISSCAAPIGARGAEIPTLAVENHEFNLRRYVGQNVRVCGRVVREGPHWGVARIPPPEEFYFHGPPTVLVIACGAAPPSLDRAGCITGRVAAEDGSLRLAPRRNVQSDDSPIDRDWFLHPQCSTPRR